MSDKTPSSFKKCTSCSSQSKPDSSADLTSKVDLSRRRFLRLSMQTLGGIAAVCALIPFVSSLKPNRRTLADNGPLEVDLSGLQSGQQMTVVWRGKPIWIMHRTPEMLAQLERVNPDLRDPSSLVPQQPIDAQNNWRSIRPEYLVLIGICTHLGCTPHYKNHDPMFSNEAGGFYCPCHGSRYDLSGRVYRNVPAPINMEVPPYQFIGEHKILIGGPYAT